MPRLDSSAGFWGGIVLKKSCSQVGRKPHLAPRPTKARGFGVPQGIVSWHSLIAPATSQGAGF